MNSPKLMSLVIFIILFQLNGINSLTQEQLDLIDATVILFQTQNNVTGMALAVVQDGELAIAKGYGKRDLDEDLDVDSDTLFAIASVTKSMCGLMIVKVLSETFPELGEAVLDEPIANLVPNANFTLSDRFRSESTSFRDLVSHRSCIETGSWIARFEAASFDDYIYRTRYNPETCSHRAGFLYNSGLYALAGSLLGQIARKPYSKLVAEVFTELGMTSSRTIDAEGSHEDLPYMSRAYVRLGQEVLQFDKRHLRRLNLIGGGGDVLSTASDMVQYIRFYLNGGRVDGKQIIPEDVLNWMYKVSVPLPAAGFPSIHGAYGYTLGFQMARFEGQPRIHHAGFWPPYESSINLFPLIPVEKIKNVGIFSTTNGPGATGVSNGFTQNVVHETIMKILKEVVLQYCQFFQPSICNSDDVTDLEQLHQVVTELKLKNNALIYDAIDPLYGLPVRTKKFDKLISPVSEKITNEELVGIFGNREHGEIAITLHLEKEEALNINYGLWGIGILTPNPSGTNYFDVEFISPTVFYDFYAFGGFWPVPVFKVYFPGSAELNLVVDGVAIVFHRDATIDTFPEIPWSSDSCAPQTLRH